MSHEDADAEQDTCCRDELGHKLSSLTGGQSSSGSFPDDFVELGKWFRRTAALTIYRLAAALGEPAVAPIDRR
jgi:hypothetical protein